MPHNPHNGFPHQRLDAYKIALELVHNTVDIARTFPRGFADLRDQVQRAALATVRHIAEGASRTSAADKRQRFVVARGECAECDASLETAAILGFGDITRIDAARVLAGRVGAMLTGLVRRLERAHAHTK